VEKVISCLVQTTIKAIPFSYLRETIFATHVSISIHFGKNKKVKAVASKKAALGSTYLVDVLLFDSRSAF